MKTVCSVLITILAIFWAFRPDIKINEEPPDEDESKQPPPTWFAELTSKVKGKVLLPSSPGYWSVTRVHNGVCINQPEVVVVPSNERDVVEVVLFVVAHGLQLSVRSGGHSYACTSSRVGGLHLDMRGLQR